MSSIVKSSLPYPYKIVLTRPLEIPQTTGKYTLKYWGVANRGAAAGTAGEAASSR